MAKDSTDRRVLRTRRMLHHALNALTLQKGYDATTVQDICKAANIGRSTFYAHYTSKDDLKRRGLECLREELGERRQTSAATQPVAPFSFSLAMFEHARDHLPLYRALAGSRGRQVALATIRKVLAELVRAEVAALPNERFADAATRALAVEYTLGAWMAVLTWWLESGAEPPPKEVDAVFRRFLVEGVVPPPLPKA